MYINGNSRVYLILNNEIIGIRGMFMDLGIIKNQSTKVRRNRQARKALRLFADKHKEIVAGTGLEENELLKTVVDAKNEWLETIASFEHVYEDNLIDYYTYKMKACEARYSYYIKKAKEIGIMDSQSDNEGRDLQ